MNFSIYAMNFNSQIVIQVERWDFSLCVVTSNLTKFSHIQSFKSYTKSTISVDICLPLTAG